MSRIQDIRLFSFSHHNTSLQVRDALAFSPADLDRFVPDVQERFEAEVAVLSTCNRTEFYLYGNGTEWEDLGELVANTKHLDLRQLSRPSSYMGKEAARHLFRVAASMESLALGEDQILAQVKDVHRQILEFRDRSPVLDRLYQFAIRAGKRVRTETSLCEGAVSISSASVELSKRIFGAFDDLEIALVGAGETSESAAEHFKANGANHFVVVNRGEERGKRLADAFHGVYRPLDELEDVSRSADIVVLATGSPDFLLTKAMMKRVMKSRGYRSLFIIDISNPRNVEPKVGDISGVFLYNIDDLESVIEDNLKSRQSEIPRAEAIIEELVEEWDLWMQTMRVRPTIAGLAQFFDELRRQELERRASKLDDSSYELLEEFSKSLIKKLLHNPIMYLRSGVEQNTLRPEDIDVVWQLYKLDEWSEDD